MWRYTARRYRDNPAVAGYHLMVEPNADEVFFEVYDPDDFNRNMRIRRTIGTFCIPG